MGSRRLALLIASSLLLAASALVGTGRLLPASAASSTPVTFAVIGDYGGGDTNNSNETVVANLVKSWNPGFVVTVGDDWYPWVGGTNGNQFDLSTGKYYCQFLAGITTPGHNCSQPGPSSVNRFFPALGNHEYDAGTTNGLPSAYTTYFNLPGKGVVSSNTSGNERYYDFVQGPIHFFVINSDNGSGQEPDGVTSTSKQAMWLKARLAAATEPWKIVMFHHPPFSSGIKHGSSAWMDWPFAQWGANVVLAGHEHLYERVMRNGIAYFTDGAGGASRVGYTCGTRVAGSQICYDGNFGALRASASDTTLDFTYVTADGVTRDSYHLAKGVPASTPTATRPPATGTPRPTAVPTSRPTPVPSKDTVFMAFVASAGDDGYQDGTSFTSDSKTLWIGDNRNPSSSYAAVRFAGVAVPQGKTIQKATLQVYSFAGDSTAVKINLYGDANGNSAPFSTSSLPSQRTHTQATISYANLPTWQAGSWDSFDATSIVQEITNRGDWASGHALSLILKGTSGLQGARRGAQGYASWSSGNVARLEITYH